MSLSLDQIGNLQDTLRERMSDISEDCYCAGWEIDLDVHLWEILEGDSDTFGMCSFAEDDVRIAELRTLRDVTDSWPDHTGNACMSVAEWQRTRGGRHGT